MDPTAVLDKRAAAFVVDAIFVGIATVFLTAVAVQAEMRDFASIADAESYCAGLNSTLQCTPFDQGVILWNLNGLWLAFAWHLGLWLTMGFTEALTGASLGKHVFGLRVVHADGSRVRPFPAILRYAVGVVDAFPWGAPMLFGLFVAANSLGHQRLGDRLAGTFVVKKEAAGQPLPELASMNPQLPYPNSRYSPTPTAAMPAGVWWDDELGAYLFSDVDRSLQWDDQTRRWHPTSSPRP